MASTDKIIEGFPHPSIPPIVGQPSFDSLQALKILLSTNAASIISHLGNGILGLLWLTVSDTVYNTLSVIPFVPPANPGPSPVIPVPSTQAVITAITNTHKRESRIFHEFNNTDKALKQLLLGAVDDMFTRALKNRFIGYANVTTKALLTHLFTTYGKISGNDLRLNTAKMNTPYDVNLPIEVLFDQVEDGMEYADAGMHPFTPQQIVMTGQQLLQETGMFADDLKIWKRLPLLDRTWVRLKADFSIAHQELRENATLGQSTFRQEANNAYDINEVTEAMANFASAAASDRATVEQLALTVQKQAAELVAVNAQLVAALARADTLNNKLSAGGRGTGRGAGRGRGATTLSSRVGGPTGKWYCWSCGDKCYHSSARCRTKKEGHQDGATVDNKMGGSTHSFAN